MPKADVPLAEIRKTRMAHRMVHGGRGLTKRSECWGAETADGIWDFEREDSPGTPWLAYHKPSVADGSYSLPVMMLGTLRACRILAVDGTLDQQLAQRKADPDTARLAALLAAQKAG